jgi:23S rRNA (uracil1939-C5)-methyltransferase
VRAEAAELLESSPARVPPRCRHFTDCGGCHYQHLAVSAQLEAKAAQVREQLARLGGIPNPPLNQPVPSPASWHYRNHVRFHRATDGRPGFRAFRSERVVSLQECHLPEPELAALWPDLELAPDEIEVTLRRGSCGVPLVWRRRAGPDRPPAARLAFELPGGRFQVSAGTFFQVNTLMAALLAEEALRALAEHLQRGGQGATLADLFCGAGLFSLHAAPLFQQIIGMELAPEACRDFRDNLRGYTHARVVQGAVEDLLPGLEARPQAVIADPPRAGLGARTIRLLADLEPAVLIYVSCDPATLARDALLLSQRGFRLQSVTPFDLFPQTYHIETLSVWSLRRAPAIIVP